MNFKSCIKFPLLWLLLFTHLCAETSETTIVPFDANKDNFLDEPHQAIAKSLPQTSFLDLVWVLVKTLLVISALIAVLYFVVYFFKRLTEQRFSGRIQGEDIRLLERATLSNKSAIYLLEVKNKYFLIGESHNGLTQLGEIDP